MPVNAPFTPRVMTDITENTKQTMKDLKPPLNVFIDTSIYRSNGFSLNKPTFNTLRSLCQSGKIRLFTTDITKKEIEANILKSLKELRSEFKKIESKNRIIETIGGEGYKDIFHSSRFRQMATTIENDIDSYLQECNTQLLNAFKLTGEDIFEAYFSQQAPFSEGKKSEFPDAFVLKALDTWAVKKQEDFIVISTDPDFSSYCDKNNRFCWYEKLYPFIHCILKDENTVVAVVEDLVVQNMNSFTEEISKQIEWNGIYLDDAEGDILIHNLESWTIHEVSVVEIQDDYANVILNITAKMNLQADYWDPDSWYSVKDEGVKEIYYHERCEGDFQAEFDVDVEIGITFNGEKFRIKEIEEVTVNSGNSLSYSHNGYFGYDD